LTFDVENIFNSVHSHDEHLWQRFVEILPLNKEILHHTKLVNRRTHGRTYDPKTIAPPAVDGGIKI